MATFDEKVVEEMTGLCRPRVKTPAARRRAAGAPAPPAPASSCLAVDAGDVTGALAESAATSLAAVAADRLVRRDRALHDAQ